MERSQFCGAGARGTPRLGGWATGLLGLSALLPACMVGLDYARPEVSVNDTWLEMRDSGPLAEEAVDVSQTKSAHSFDGFRRGR